MQNNMYTAALLLHHISCDAIVYLEFSSSASSLTQ